MGVDGRKPPLPAPTEASTIGSITGDSHLGTDIHTEISTRTDKTSYSIPEDGSPVTISTRPKREKNRLTSLSRDANRSQTSLLIEYFEGGKSGPDVQQRPSVRVKVTPSAARKIRDVNDHIQITETKGEGRVPSFTRRISLAPNKGDRQLIEGGDDKSLSSLNSAIEESNLTQGHPIEVEVMHRDRDSPLASSDSPRHKRFVPPNPSEISSIPPDTFIETSATQHTTSRGLQAPPERSRSVSRERALAAKVRERLESDRNKESKSRHKRRSKSRSRSASKEHLESVRSPRRRSSKSHGEEVLQAGEDRSQVTGSQVSGRSAGQDSIRSTTTSSSINNPKLLATVEDVIKRLVLPQIDQIKQEQKSHNSRERFDSADRRGSAASIESTTREAGRRLSKTSSAPDVSPRVVLNQPEGSGTVKTKRRKSRKSDRELPESPSERGYSEDTVTDDLVLIPKRRGKHSTAKEATLAGTAALTAEALTHHESKSSLDTEKRRKKRSKSRSRGASVTVSESVETTPRRGVPMPISSDINSELTRESILTEKTERPPSAASQERHISRAALTTPTSRTPTKTPVDVQKGFGTHHTNLSREDVSLKSGKSSREVLKHQYDSHGKGVDPSLPMLGAAAGAAAFAGSQRLSQSDEHHESSHLGGSRGLSPVQSVASYKDRDFMFGHHESLHHVHSEGSLSSIAQISRRKDKHSANSLRDTPSIRVSDHRQSGNGPTVESYTVPGHEPDPLAKDLGGKFWYEQHQENNRNRNTFDSATTDHTTDYNRFTQSTDNSGNYLDKVAAGQHVLGVGANPEYRYTPVAARSAVASLHEASVMETRSLRSERSKLTRQSYPDSLGDGIQPRIDTTGAQDFPPTQENSPTKRAITTSHSDQSTSQKSFVQRMAEGETPAVNQDRPLGILGDEDEPKMTASAMPLAHSPIPDFGGGTYEGDSDIQTNPSIIQGVASREYPGLNKEFSLDQQAKRYDGPDTTKDLGDLGPASTAVGLGAMAGYGQHDVEGSRDGLDTPTRDRNLPYKMERDLSDPYLAGTGASPMQVNKDEGYISAAPNALSPGGITPDPYDHGPKLFDDDDPDGVRGIGGYLGGEDPFVSKGHTRHLSGYSYGVGSPLYDSATGKGLDRIQSKDIVALMDHLTVRDAHRNARDTEILVTLVRSAAEMRNSFEDMKKLLSDSEMNIISGTDKNTERIVQKHIQGPRPQPLGTPRIPRSASMDGDTAEDLPAKRRNVFTRALKGLRMRSTNDLTHIEDMLFQLLTEVETLKDAQGIGTKEPSINRASASEDNLPAAQDGYEPEGFAGTSSATQSGYLSNSSSRQPINSMRGTYEGRRISEHRISTVPEGDEDQAAYDDLNTMQPHQEPEFEEYEGRLTPSNDVQRGASLPLQTPPKIENTSMPLSNENTPRTDRSKKHKSGGSSIFPKFSRWSETTASTVARFKPGRKSKEEHPYQVPHSRSGSEIEFWTGPQGPTDKLHSTYSLEEEQRYQRGRPPSPLVPSEPDDQPPQQAYRNSINLEHPRPRPGPTDRFQNHLENQAHHFDSPVSPSSDQWGSNPILQRYSTGSNKRYSGGAGNLSPISDGGYSQTSSHGPPPRPAQIPEDPLVPRQSKAGDNKPTYASPLSAEHLSPEAGDYIQGGARSGYATSSPRSSSGQVPTRKPVGPRPPSSPFANDGANSPRRTRNRDTFGASQRDDDVTF
ncbi:MAG: hypothetical protein M1814_001196 [Vezdaea aestivalis]|nr:MAG: hypothetical protein M1814_001196 [Vezdaea aestivalis]